jgi:hypothetical protein
MFKSADHISFGYNIDKKIVENMKWSLLPYKGIHSVLDSSQCFANFITSYEIPVSKYITL